MGKKGKGRSISKIKQKNIQGGKMTKGKKTKEKGQVKARKKIAALAAKLKMKNSQKNVKVEITAKDVLDMLGPDDLRYLSHEKVDLIRNIPEVSHNHKKRANVDFEEDYENRLVREGFSQKKQRNLLPIKTNGQLHTMEDEEEEEPSEEPMEAYEEGNGGIEEPDVSEDTKGVIYTTGKLMAIRRQKLEEVKFKIGILSASFLEDPINRLKNLDSLLAILQTSEASVSLSAPKICIISLTEVFLDVLPNYSIKHQNAEGIKLKKDTRELQGFESNLLRRYKIFLQTLEKFVKKYIPKHRTNKNIQEFKLGMLSLKSMCDFLDRQPYFNLATNIINFVLPLLNNWDPQVRIIVVDCIQKLFREDKRGQVSYEVVRRLNLIVKSRVNGEKNLEPDILRVLFALRIRESDLIIKDNSDLNPNKKTTFEQRKLLSKSQRKKAKGLVQVERELLEASAQENKAQKSHFLTEITKLVFTIYFRAIKNASEHKALLSAVLEGLSKFAHVMSVEYFGDLLGVLKQLIGEVGERERLHCISTVFSVLSGQGAALTLDPSIFHKHLYCSLLNLKAGQRGMSENVGLAMKCLRLACGRKQLPGPRALAFAKRTATIALQVEHSDAIAILLQLSEILKCNASTDVLLETDGSLDSGVYLDDLDDPDHAHAESTTLWELLTLTKHYHPWVGWVANKILQIPQKDHNAAHLTKKLAEDIATELGNPLAEFEPALPVPKTQEASKRPKATPLILKTSFFKQNSASLTE